MFNFWHIIWIQNVSVKLLWIENLKKQLCIKRPAMIGISQCRQFEKVQPDSGVPSSTINHLWFEWYQWISESSLSYLCQGNTLSLTNVITNSNCIQKSIFFFNVVDFWWSYSTIFLLLHVTCYYLIDYTL